MILSLIRKRQSGMTLLEVIVSILLVGLGMTGSIAMIQTSMRNNTMAFNRNSAMYLSEAIVDKLQMNKFAIDQYLHNDPSVDVDLDTNEKKLNLSDECGTTCASDNAKVAAFAQARQDMELWYQELRDKLPGANFAVYAVDPTNSRYAVKLVWPNIIDKSHWREGETNDETPTDSIVTVFTL